MDSSQLLSLQQKRKWYRTASSWLMDFIELSPKTRLRQLETNLRALDQSMTNKGFSQALNTSLSLWILDYLEREARSSWTPKPLRVLHQVEREYITPEAYGLFLQAMQSGILAVQESEHFLEKLAQKHQLPIEIEQLEEGLANFWLRKLDTYKPQ